jgi:hypothetical protein
MPEITVLDYETGRMYKVDSEIYFKALLKAHEEEE